MEVKIDNEAQVCRLCGQFESIYIDVFGDEGSKRLLGLKIQSKINILIDETDPLPKTICVQCLGKLEFVCDFQEECLRTQRLLRNRYDLPPLPDIENDIKLEIQTSSTQSSPSTSTNNNNNNNNNTTNNNNNNNNNENKNHNSTADIENVDPSIEDTTTVQTNTETIRPKRIIKTPTRNKCQIKDNNNNKDNKDKNILTIETPELTKRWLRSRNTTDTSTPKLKQQQQKTSSAKKIKLQTNESTPSTSNTNNVSIVTRLRSSSQNQQQKLNISLNNNNKKLNKSQDDKEKRTLQIPTSALDKVITAVSTSTDVKVSVKETTKNNKNNSSNNNNNEDISFTLELKKKEKINDTPLTVLAKVFPDQNSSLVDSEIIDLLDDNSHINKLINTVQSKTKTTTTTTSSCKNRKNISSSIDDDSVDDLELRLAQITEGIGFDNDGNLSRNPEELYRIDGEEIRVDDNVDIITTADGPTGYSCKLCKKLYERRDKCTVHVKTHLGIKQYACTLCTAKFVCKSDVMKHIRCSHTNPRPMQCPKCPKRFRSKFDLTEHDNIHKGIKPYRCNDCGQSYHHKVSLQMHVKSHLPPQNLACEYCGKVFPFRTRLLSHIASVHLKNRRNFRCRFCYNLYSSLNVLNDHIKTRHATTYTCDICSKTFKVSSKYKAHVLQHTNPKPYACKICNNRYASKAFLNEHLLKHEGLRKHVCQKCGASFAQASHLAAHRHVHGEKTHICPECGRKFNRRDNMKVHRKRHAAETGRIVDGYKSIIDDDDDDDGGYDDDDDVDADEASDK